MPHHLRRFFDSRPLIAAFLVIACSIGLAQTKQEHVHHMGASVMPFDLAKTTHIFRMTVTGGVQRVIIKEPNAMDQLAMIRQHLKYEAEAFQRGEYSDPAALHGADMPGLKELQAGAKQISVSYATLPNGAMITFETSNPELLTAIHRWFGAQLSEHGADAIAE